MPKVSVVIAVYNKEKYLTETLKRVFNQTYVDFEVVIVNDGSTDNSGQVIQEFADPRIRYFKQENKGVAAARNCGIQKAEGEFIALLDADDWWEKTYLESLVKLIEKYPEEKVFASAVLIEGRDGVRDSNYSVSNLRAGETRVLDYFESSCLNSVLTSSSAIIRKSLLEEVGMFNEKHDSGEDTDLWVRLGLRHSVVFFNEPLVTYKFTDNSLSVLSQKEGSKALFEEYVKEENRNAGLKKFLDLNRFSLAIRAKLIDDGESEKIISQIDLRNLGASQRFLLKAPRFLLVLLIQTKRLLEGLGIRLSVFSA